MYPTSSRLSPEEGIRLARRRTLDAEITLRDPDGHGEVLLPCHNLSVTGALVAAPIAVSPGSEFICDLHIAGEPVQVRGRVARVCDHGAGTVGLGIQFTDLAREAHERLVAFTLPMARA
jgi:hypothetical protein